MHYRSRTLIRWNALVAALFLVWDGYWVNTTVGQGPGAWMTAEGAIVLALTLYGVWASAVGLLLYVFARKESPCDHHG